MAKTLTQGDIRAWARMKDYWTPVRVVIARASALAEQRFVNASRGGKAKCAPFHEHYWTVEQIEKDLEAAGYVIVEKAEIDRLREMKSEAALKAANPLVMAEGEEPDPQPKRRGRPPKARTMQQGDED